MRPRRWLSCREGPAGAGLAIAGGCKCWYIAICWIKPVSGQRIYRRVTRTIPLPARTSRQELRKLSRTGRSEEHTSELQSRGHLVCRLLLEKKKATNHT